MTVLKLFYLKSYVKTFKPSSNFQNSSVGGHGEYFLLCSSLAIHWSRSLHSDLSSYARLTKPTCMRSEVDFGIFDCFKMILVGDLSSSRTSKFVDK